MIYTEKQQEIIDYLKQNNYYLHLNEYIPFKQKTKKKLFFIKEYQVDKNDHKESINIDQNATKELIKNKVVKEIEYHIKYNKTYVLKKI
jgi:hypothetical protein